jgi:hypothetical protein
MRRRQPCNMTARTLSQMQKPDAFITLRSVSKRALQLWKAYTNLFRGHVQRFELPQCSKSNRVLPGVVRVQCDFHW